MNHKTSTLLRITVRPWGLLTAAGGVACSATLFGFLGRVSWFLDLFSHFRAQYLFGLSILGILFLAARRYRTAAVCLVFACINLCVVLPLYFGGRDTVPEGARKLRAMLINVNTRLGDAERVKEVIRDVDPDILVLEEISSQWLRDLQFLAESHPHSCVSPRGDNFGIGLFSKRPLIDSEIVSIGSAGVPSILATVDTGRGRLRVIATHPPPPKGAAYSRWRNDQLDRLADHTHSALPLILLGDLNATPWNDHFRRLLKRSGLIDSARGRGVQPTWQRGNPLLSIPLDHCLHSPGICVVNRTIGADVGSDHFPLIVDLVINAARVENGPQP